MVSEEKTPRESEETDLNNREAKRWEPETKYSKYMASYFRKQVRHDDNDLSNVTNLDLSRAEILPKVESVLAKFASPPIPKKEKASVDYNRDFEPDVDHND